MHIDLFMEYMSMWARWMKSEDHRLGYPQKSVGVSGASSTTFDDMIDEADSEVIRVINSSMDSVRPEEVNAIWARYLGTKKPMYYELKLESGLNHLREMVERRLQM